MEGLSTRAPSSPAQEPCPRVPLLLPRKPLPSGLCPWAQGSTAGIGAKPPGLFHQLLRVCLLQEVTTELSADQEKGGLAWAISLS